MTSDRVVSDLMLPLWEEVLWRAHNLHAMECPREIRAVRLALHLPFEEKADGPQGADSVWAQHLAAPRASLPLDEEEAVLCASEAFNFYIGDGFLIPELKDESESSEDEQADSPSENNVGNGAMFVIGLQKLGDTIALFLQDWEVAKVASSCQKALDMLCQEFFEVERRRGWFGFLNDPVG